MKNRTTLLVISVALVLIVIGVLVYNNVDFFSTQPSAELPRLPVSKELHPEESTVVRHPSGASIEVQTGSIDRLATISISEASPPQECGELQSAVYEFTMVGSEIYRPVTLQIPYNVPAAIAPEDLYAIRWSEEQKSWEVLGGEVDPTSQTIQVEVSHLSMYSVSWNEPSSTEPNLDVQPRITAIQCISEAVCGNDFQIDFSVKNIGEDDFFGNGYVELSFPGYQSIPGQKSKVIQDWKAPGKFFPLLFSTSYSTNFTFDPFVASIPEPGPAVLQLDLVFANPDGIEIARDSCQATILVTNLLRIASDSVTVNGNEYLVKTQDLGSGSLEYSVRSSGDDIEVRDTDVRTKAIYTAAIQQDIRKITADGYVFLNKMYYLGEFTVRLSDPVIWVLSHPGRFTAAVFTGGYWGVALEFLNELTAEAIIALGKQIGEHPEHYTEQVAMDFLEYLVDLDSKWLDMKKRVADGYPLSFSDAIVFQNDHYFDIIYGPPAVDTKREIINNKYQWTDGEKDSFLAAIKILISSSELSSAISTGLFINDLYETAKLFHSPLMEYPPYEHMYTSININYEQAKQSYTKFLENVGLSSQKICELAVLQTHFHKANSFSVNVQSPNLLDEFVSVDGAELQYDHPYGQSAMIGDMIYAISGPSGEESAVSIIESANILPGGGISAWDTVGSIDLRHQAAVAATSENIYIIGGYPTSGRVTRIPIVDGQLQNEISEPYVHAPRYAARAFVHQNYLYIVGGLQDPDSPVPGVERAKIFSNGSLSEWLPAPSLINSRGGFALVKGSQYVWALGGTGDSGLLDSVERAELLSDGGLGEWASGFTSLPEVEFPSAIMIGDCIYFIGSTGNEDQPVYILGLDETMQLSQPFESSKLNFAPRQQPIMFASDTYLYISGGRSNSDTGTDTWRQTERAAFIYNITSGYIGPEGGSISLETGNGLLTVTFPKGAVDHGVNVDLSAKNAFIGLSEGLSIIGNTMHSISCPINLFNERVTIAFPLPEIDSKYSYSVECLGEDEWVDIGGILDPASDTILVAVDHFTDFIVTSVLRDTGSDAEQLHITNNYTPNFEFQTDEAYVFSVKSPVGKPAIADVVAEEMINTLAQYISQGMVEGSVVPGWGTVIGAVSGLLKAMDEKYNPIRIVPLTKTIKINDGLVEAGDLLSNNEVSFLVLLDFLGTEKDKEYIDRYRRGLWFYAENRYGYRIYEMRELLSEDQMRKLDPSKSYIICPKRSVRFFPESYAINASEAFLRTESLWLTKWPTVSLLGKELSFYGRDGQRIRVPLEKTSLPKPEDHQTSKIVQYSSDGDFSAASILARKLNAQIIKTTDIIQLLEYNEWILVGADQANPVYKKVFGQRVTLKDEGYIRIDHEEFLYLGTTYSVWGAASYMAQDTLNSAKWIVEHGWPAQTIRLPWIVVQYSSDADYQAANLIAKQRGWDIIKTSDISDLEEYEGWVIVGAQDANPVFNQVFGPLIDQNDQGYILINEKDYVYQQQNRAVWGIASWSIQDTEESARWVIQWGLPSQSIRQRY